MSKLHAPKIRQRILLGNYLRNGSRAGLGGGAHVQNFRGTICVIILAAVAGRELLEGEARRDRG